MSQKSLPISEIRQKYYQNISRKDFIKIASADSVSSNLKKNKLGKYAKWMLNLYKRKCLKLEDLYKATEYIALFDKIAKINKLPDIDLNHYTSLAKMYQVIKPFAKTTGQKEKQRKIKEKDAEKIFENEDFVIIYPKTKLASILYGKGTQWCTAAEYSNSFQNYNCMGNLYIIIDKRNGKKYQFHYETKSFMDEDNSPIDDVRYDWKEILNVTPELDYYLKKLKIHPDWMMYTKINCKGQLYYIVKKYANFASNFVLYDANFKEVIDNKFGAEEIIPFPYWDISRENQLVIIKNNNIGIYYIDTDTIRWDYRGVVNDKTDWIGVVKLY